MMTPETRATPEIQSLSSSQVVASLAPVLDFAVATNSTVALPVLKAILRQFEPG